MTALILLAVVAILVYWFISCQRSLVSLDELCFNALSQIGVQQQSRWDALTALAELTKSYSEYEYKALMEIIAQRRPINGNSTAKEVNAQENMLTEAMTRFMAVAEAYPDLKASDMYKQTMDSVNMYENNVRQSRMVYNDSVTKFNRYVRQIPSNIVASLLHFSTRDYLEEDKAKSTVPSMKI